MSKTMVIHVCAPVQSWRVAPNSFERRFTNKYPTKSGLLGCLGAAMGMQNDDDVLLQELAALEMDVRVERSGSLFSDFKTCYNDGGSGHMRANGKIEKNDGLVFHDYYVADAEFLVSFTGDSGLLARCNKAICQPKYSIYFGSKNCVPSMPLYVNELYDDRTILESFPWRKRDKYEEKPELLMLIQESSWGEKNIEIIKDQPLSFNYDDINNHSIRFLDRYISKKWITTDKIDTYII